MDAIYGGMSLLREVFSRHDKALKHNLPSTSFRHFVYSIIGGFEGDGVTTLATKFLSSAMDSGFYIIRNRIYRLGKKNKKKDVQNFRAIVIKYIVAIRLIGLTLFIEPLHLLSTKKLLREELD